MSTVDLWLSDAIQHLHLHWLFRTCAHGNPTRLVSRTENYQLSYRNKRFVEGQWSQKCPSSDCIRPGVSSGTVPVRLTSKSWLAAVTRTVEWRTGAMCVSQWLTCFQKSQDLMESGVYHCQCLNKYNKLTEQMDMHI